MVVLVSHALPGVPIPGRFGVTIFFFLSGYLITTLLVREHDEFGRIEIRSFWARRLLRLMPALVTTMALIYVLHLVGVVGGDATAGGAISQLFYLANYHLVGGGEPAIPAGTVVYWSLAIEEHFYLLYPLLFLGLFVGRGRKMVWALVVLCAAIATWRLALLTSGTTDFRFSLSTDTRADSIIFGCLLALTWNPATSHRRSTDSTPSIGVREVVLVAGSLAVLAAATMIGSLDPTPGLTGGKVWYSLRFTLQGLALMPLFRIAIQQAEHGRLRFLEAKPLRLLGKYSYAIYLSHYVVIFALRKAGIESRTIVLLAALVLSVAYAAWIDQVVDRRFLELRKRFRPGENAMVSIPVALGAATEASCAGHNGRESCLSLRPREPRRWSLATSS